MSSATRHVEGDPLEALRSELVAAGRRRVARRRRGRRTAVLAAALVGLLALAAGAAALMNFSTGVPAVDTLLEIESPDSPASPGATSGRDRAGPPSRLRCPRATAQRTRSPIWPVMARSATPPRTRSARGSTGGCWRVADLARALDRRKIVWNGLTAGADNRVFDGYADGDVTAIRVVGRRRCGHGQAERPVDAHGRPGPTPLRHFVVIDEEDIQMDERDLVVEFPPLVVTLSDGTTRRIAPS